MAGRYQRIALAYLRLKERWGEIPTSIRFLFYELEQRGRISKEKREVKPGCKTARTHSQDLTEALTHIRDRGLVPWDWIVDERRRVDDWSSDHATVMEALVSAAEHVRIDPWGGVKRPFILTEDAATSGVLSRRSAYEYRVPVASVSGNCRGFLETRVAWPLKLPNTRVLYLGDADDCGNAIERNTRRVLAHATGRAFGPDEWERVAITPEQIEVLRAAGMEPIQKRDDRYGDGNPHLAWECEALGQTEIERLVAERLDELLPEPLADVFVRESEQREAASEALAGLWAAP
jgi:hypothetical protein